MSWWSSNSITRCQRHTPYLFINKWFVLYHRTFQRYHITDIKNLFCCYKNIEDSQILQEINNELGDWVCSFTNRARSLMFITSLDISHPSSLLWFLHVFLILFHCLVLLQLFIFFMFYVLADYEWAWQLLWFLGLERSYDGYLFNHGSMFLEFTHFKTFK